MLEKFDISLREYLHLQAKRAKNPPCIEEYDDFLLKVWGFFKLRVDAEEYFKNNKHVAYSRHGALPISWELIKEVWEDKGPPEQQITLIAKNLYNDINELVGNLRKVLNRVRQKVAISRVQQVDSHCLRWLTRQPGYTAAEKGGSRQEILGVVRLENYDTLENRVLKDFLQRCIGLSVMYLRRYEKYRDHVNITAVMRFKNLCVKGLASPELVAVRKLSEVPQPNYVLQQDRLYSRVWISYCDILRQEDVAEKLWSKRKEINELYKKCITGIVLHCSPFAKYKTPLWINPLDGRSEIIENPIWENELSQAIIEEPNAPQNDEQIIDFTYPWDNRDQLVYPHNHKNARPFIQNPHRPSLEPGEIVSINEILRKRDGGKLSDYFRQLYGLIKGIRWIVLVPDDWEPQWLECVIRSQPSLLPSGKLFLLWRSVAAALGMMESQIFNDNDSLVIADGVAVPFYNVIELRFVKDDKTGRILPQQASPRLHSIDGNHNCTDIRYFLKKSFSDHASFYKIGGASARRLVIGRLSRVNFVTPSDRLHYCRFDLLLYEGVKRFLKEEFEGLVSYFDEIDALSLVVQNRAEEVEFKTLIHHEERWPGGSVYKGAVTRGGALQMGATKLSLNLLEGEHKDDERLKEMHVVLEEKTPQTTDIFFEATMTPGQGLAKILFKADFLEKPLPLDLTELQVSDVTKSRIEREMKRHFPPVMPYVEASEAIWNAIPSRHNCTISETVRAYVENGILPPSDTFAQAQPYWGIVDPTGKLSYRKYGKNRYFDEQNMSPVDKLKRENVFGNAPTHRLPACNWIDWGKLFKNLARDYKSGKNVIRLIAWSYQYDSSCFDFLRKELYDRYVKCSQDLTTMEITFCANNYPPNSKMVSGLLGEVLERISEKRYKQEELRLAYNLMQFHPGAMKDQDSTICERAMRRLVNDYNNYPFYQRGFWGGAGATKAAGYYLKCMLFLLHRRRFDSSFLKRAETWSPTGFLGELLPEHTSSLQNHERTRIAFINYVRGHGSIDGIPLGD